MSDAAGHDHPVAGDPCPECGGPLERVFEPYELDGRRVYFGDLPAGEAAQLLARSAAACPGTHWLVAGGTLEQARRVVFTDIGPQLRSDGVEGAQWLTGGPCRRLRLPNGSQIWAGGFLGGMRLAGAWLLDLERRDNPEAALAEATEAMEGIPPDDPCIALSSSRNPAWDVLERAGWRSPDHSSAAGAGPAGSRAGRRTGAPRAAIRFSALIWALNSLIDRGKKAGIDEVHEHITDGSLWTWLRETFGLPVGVLGAEDMAAMLELFGSLFDADDPARNFWIERNGLATLLAYCAEGLQQLAES